MQKKLEAEIYDVLASIEEYFSNGSPVYPGSLNSSSVDDETMHGAVRRLLFAMQKGGK